jgi:hypothetical protein
MEAAAALAAAAAATSGYLISGFCPFLVPRRPYIATKFHIYLEQKHRRLQSIASALSCAADWAPLELFSLHSTKFPLGLLVCASHLPQKMQ